MFVIGEQEIEAVARVIRSGRLFRYEPGGQSETDRLERDLEQFAGVRHALATSSGTASLMCSLAAMGVGPGDEVVVPGYTFIATPLAALAVGAVPVIAEIDESLTIDPADVARKITPRTKAVVPVDMCGLPCDMDALLRVASGKGVAVLEDACQAVGGSWRGRRLGSLGGAGVYSFNCFKNATAGEGGALLTNDTGVYERALIQHDGGCAFFSERARRVGVPLFAGWNFRVSEILSAVVRVQLGRVEGLLARLRAEKRLLEAELGCVGAFTPNPVRDPEGDCATKLALLFESGRAARRFIGRLAREGVVASTPIDSGRHVYSNWEAVMQKRGAHCPGRDPYRAEGVSVEYSPDMCPTTLDILARTVCLDTSPARPEEETRDLARAIRDAAGSGGG